jgi:hypothetical protein
MVAAAGVTTTELPAVGADETGGVETDCGMGDDPQPDRVSTADSGVMTRRLRVQVEFISYTSVEARFREQGARCNGRGVN